MEKSFLFVYGTLRSDFPLENGSVLKKNLVFRGRGLVQAILFDVGTYPAAVEGLDDNYLQGELYEVLQPTDAFAILDAYEGEDYMRKLTEVLLSNGATLMAWMYWYKCDVTDLHRIQENDYLAYLKNKKDRFV